MHKTRRSSLQERAGQALLLIFDGHVNGQMKNPPLNEWSVFHCS